MFFSFPKSGREILVGRVTLMFWVLEWDLIIWFVTPWNFALKICRWSCTELVFSCAKVFCFVDNDWDWDLGFNRSKKFAVYSCGSVSKSSWSDFMLNGSGPGLLWCSISTKWSVSFTFYRCKTAKYLANSNPAGLSTLLVLKEVQELKKADLLRDIRWAGDSSFFRNSFLKNTVFTCLAGLRFESWCHYFF